MFMRNKNGDIIGTPGATNLASAFTSPSVEGFDGTYVKSHKKWILIIAALFFMMACIAVLWKYYGSKHSGSSQQFGFRFY